MTFSATASTARTAAAKAVSAVIDGVDVDAVAVAVLGCAGVAGLDGGQFGEAASYLPGRIVAGIVVRPDRLQVQVRARWTPLADLARQVIAVATPLAGQRPVDVVIADIDEPATSPPDRF